MFNICMYNGRSPYVLQVFFARTHEKNHLLCSNELFMYRLYDVLQGRHEARGIAARARRLACVRKCRAAVLPWRRQELAQA